MKIWLWLLVGCLGSLVELQSADPVFMDGEELVYSAKWTGVPAGEITLSSKRLEAEKWQFSLDAKTNYVWSLVYKVRDIVRSTVSTNPFKSLYFYKDAKQGRRHIEEKISFDYEKQEVVRSKQNHSAHESANINKIKMEAEHDLIQDPLSMIYGVRHFSFLKKEEMEQKFFVFASKGIYELQFELMEELNFESAIFGNRRVWHIKPTAEYEGSLVASGTLELWLDCETGIPLRLLFNIPLGWATLELTKSNNPKLISTTFRERRRR